MIPKAPFPFHPERTFMWSPREIAAIQKYGQDCAKEAAAECAKICAGFVDAKEETRASLAAAKAIKKGDTREIIDRLSHEGMVGLHNSVLKRCEAAIKARCGLDAQEAKG